MGQTKALIDSTAARFCKRAACTETAYLTAKDENFDGFSDTCAPLKSLKDSDGDGVPDDLDNCVSRPNSQQENADNDEFGNACDEDADEDGVENANDNCPFWPNKDQTDKNCE